MTLPAVYLVEVSLGLALGQTGDLSLMPRAFIHSVLVDELCSLSL